MQREEEDDKTKGIRRKKNQTRDSLEDESSCGARFVLGSAYTNFVVFLVEESGWGGI